VVRNLNDNKQKEGGKERLSTTNLTTEPIRKNTSMQGYQHRR
jgi:hypothetical protein